MWEAWGHLSWEAPWPSSRNQNFNKNVLSSWEGGYWRKNFGQTASGGRPSFDCMHFFFIKIIVKFFINCKHVFLIITIHNFLGNFSKTSLLIQLAAGCLVAMFLQILLLACHSFSLCVYTIFLFVWVSYPIISFSMYVFYSLWSLLSKWIF